MLQIEAAETDVLVLGGGLTGRRAAVAAAETGASVGLACMARGASPYLVAFNTPLGHADPNDSPEIYFDDMLRGGYGLNDRRLIRVLADQSVAAFDELVALGIPFARDGEHYRQRHLSGNAYPRSVYIPEGVGGIVLNRLDERLGELGTSVWSGWKVLNLLRDGAQVVGALLAQRHEGRLLAVQARSVVIAMGGIGQLYQDSTYPADVAADAYGLALDAGAQLIDMEFVQFEPTVTVHPEGCRGMEMPTAMMGDGALLLNADGERFMFRYNPEHGEKRLEKARLSLCIQAEIDEGRGLPDDTVLFDTTAMPHDRLESYVSHCRRLRAAGLDPAFEMVRVRPVAHSEMGGIFIDENGWTGVPGLYAGGEAAGGIHGASRLAGNGGGEIVVFGGVIGRGAARGMLERQDRDWRGIEAAAAEPLHAAIGAGGTVEPDAIKAALRAILSRTAGLYRDETGLRQGLKELAVLEGQIEAGPRAEDLGGAIAAGEARNMVLAGRMIVMAALARTESRGAHQRRDFADQDDAHWLQHLVFRQGRDGEPALGKLPIH
jgi:succinate dehydrogenase/fumarate reductase flavoprotein subunit